MERFLTELGDQHWDLLVFSETWRADKNEAFITQHGHAWFGSGGTRGQRGIGFLLHSRWQHSFFKPLSERCAVIGIRVTPKCRLRVIGTYMPHAAQPDEDVDVVYAMLQAEHDEAK